ncbi:MAG: sigma-70 family RNA polymerase sigma factor [Chloroflexi bacterium]|nr:sigma-70 family RNA polymerase sigma factor [Chloroflexota bacterium]MBI3170097.1 sigma-70 family RNA polymerase sigma factor [Chloroflexota bacterium]
MVHSEPLLSGEFHLIVQAKSGDSEAFGRLYDAYIERVYQYVFFRVSDDFTAEDLTSQVFLKAWENLGSYKPNGSPFVAWLYTIAKNLVVDHYRTQKEVLSLDDVTAIESGEEALDEQAELRFELRAMRDSLHLLTDDQQQVLILKFIAGLPNESIAKVMNKQEGAIRALQMRALQALAKHMEEKEIL